MTTKSTLIKPLPENFNPKKIVITMSKGMMIGDLLLATPLFRALKTSYPSCKLALLTSIYNKPILWNNKNIDELLIDDIGDRLKPVTRLIRLFWFLKKGNFDLSLNICTRTREVIASFTGGIKFRVGPVSGFPHDYLLNHRFHSELNGWSDNCHRVEYLLEYCRVLGNNYREDKEKLDLFVPKEIEENIMKKMKEEGSLNKKPLIIIHPGFSRPLGIFPSELYKDLTVDLIDKLKASVIITGPKIDYEKTRELLKDLPPHVYDWVGKTDLYELSALISKADLLIVPNTGTLHMAAALGTPVVALFDPRTAYSNVWRPYGVNHRVVEPEENGKISVKQIITGAEKLLL